MERTRVRAALWGFDSETPRRRSASLGGEMCWCYMRRRAIGLTARRELDTAMESSTES